MDKAKIDECEKAFEKAFSFWDKIGEQEKERFISGTVLRNFRAGESIHAGGGECLGGILVKSGSVRIYLMSAEGKEVTLYRLCAGETCVLSAACVLKEITFDVFVDAESDCACYIVSGPVFAAMAHESIHVENFALNLAVRRFSDVIWVMQQIMFMSFDKRLAIFLSDECAKSGTSEIRMTHEQIARYMGSAREVVSRMLKYFASEGIVTLSRGGISIADKSKLNRLATD